MSTTLQQLREAARTIDDWRTDSAKLDVLLTYLLVHNFAPQLTFSEFVEKYAGRREQLDFAATLDELCPRSKVQATTSKRPQWTMKQTLTLLSFYCDMCETAALSGQAAPSLEETINVIGEMVRKNELKLPEESNADVSPAAPDSEVAPSSPPTPAEASAANPEWPYRAGERVVFNVRNHEIPCLVPELAPPGWLQALSGELFPQVPVSLCTGKLEGHNFTIERPTLAASWTCPVTPSFQERLDAGYVGPELDAAVEWTLSTDSHGAVFKLRVLHGERGPRALGRLEWGPTEARQSHGFPPRLYYLGDYYATLNGMTYHIKLTPETWPTTFPPLPYLS